MVFKTKKKLLDPKKNRLLVVEDTPFFRKIEKNYFESAGFKVSQASNGKEALDILLGEPYSIDLIVFYDMMKKKYEQYIGINNEAKKVIMAFFTIFNGCYSYSSIRYTQV